MSMQDWSECYHCERALTDIEKMRIMHGRKSDYALCLRCYEALKGVVITESGEELEAKT